MAAALSLLSVTPNKLSTSKTDVEKLKKEFNEVTNRLNAYLLARDYIDKYIDTKKKGAENNE